MSPAIPPFSSWLPLALLGAALAFIAIRSRKSRAPRKPDSWLRDFRAEARERDGRMP